MADLDAMFKTLEDETKSLSERYIDKYIPANPEDDPLIFEYDVKAFSLMTHAAFEEFSEGVSEVAMEKIVSNFLLQKISVGTACFLMAYGQKIEFTEEENTPQRSCFNLVREALDEAKKLHSAVIMNNHGFFPKYLRKIFTPVGINISTGPEMGSLLKLADARGTFAHTIAKSAKYGEYKKAHKVLTPEEARDAVKDCLEICEKIKEQAKLLYN